MVDTFDHLRVRLLLLFLGPPVGPVGNARRCPQVHRRAATINRIRSSIAQVSLKRHRRGPPRRAIDLSTMYPAQSVSDLTGSNKALYRPLQGGGGRLCPMPRNFALAALTSLPHSAIMVETHPFTFDVVADPLSGSRYRWTVCEGSQVLVRSPHSYATRREAEKEAAKAVSRREERWRSRE